MFDKLSVKQLKDIIRTYRLLNKISMVVKREIMFPTGAVIIKSFPASKQELIEAMQQHLEITEDGEIVYKQRSSIPVKYKPEEKKKRTKKVEPEPEPISQEKSLKDELEEKLNEQIYLYKVETQPLFMGKSRLSIAKVKSTTATKKQYDKIREELEQLYNIKYPPLPTFDEIRKQSKKALKDMKKEDEQKALQEKINPTPTTDTYIPPLKKKKKYSILDTI